MVQYRFHAALITPYCEMAPVPTRDKNTSGRNPRITGLILAGGQGSRMNGADKGLLEICGATLLAAILEILQPQVANLMISANRNLSAYRQYGYPVLTDTIAGYPGPLGGILSAMDHCDTEFLLTVPCDAPLLAGDYATRMYRSLVQAGADAGVAHDGVRMQPVYSLVHRQCKESLEKYLQAGHHSAQGWVQSLHPVMVDFSDRREQFYNLNTSQDRRILEELLGKARQ